MTEEEMDYNDKIHQLIIKYGLSFMYNPGGGEFINKKLGIDIQVGDCSNKEDYESLLYGLKELGIV
jgi:hypothetical protein